MKLLIPILFLLISLISCNQPEELNNSGAGLSMDNWGLARAYPKGNLNTSAWTKGFEHWKHGIQTRTSVKWDALGPKNIGGRTLCLAFHPNNPLIIYAGSAGGGLWKSTSAGKGIVAWERVPTGFPVLGIASILINPENPDEIFIGTGEVYNSDNASIGYTNRYTRGTYGIGIIKSINGGLSWEKSLDWSYGELRGVQDMKMNPKNPKTIFAATTEGIYKTYNSGRSWSLVHDTPMAVDLEIMDSDTNIVFASHGSFRHSISGIFRSVDGGNHFNLLQNGPMDYSGKSMLTLSNTSPQGLYVSAANYSENQSPATFGLYVSLDKGDNWQILNKDNLPAYQGWYSHDVVVSPSNSQLIIRSGVNMYKSLNGGLTNEQTSYWNNFEYGQVPIGGPEGPNDYVHADIHRLYFHPLNPKWVFAATDGGIFFSGDEGESWEGRNGHYQTTQFYPNFSNSASDPNLAIGGLQDNATVIYKGDGAWSKKIGGDGMSTAILTTNDDVIFGSYYNLNLLRSLDKGEEFSVIPVRSAENESKSFCSPLELTNSPPYLLFGGAQRVHISSDLGDSWAATSNNYIDGNNTVQAIGVSPHTAFTLLVSTVPNPLPQSPISPKVWLSSDLGASYKRMNGLPDRFAMDFEFDPLNPNIFYAVFSGFGTKHVYKSENAGDTWFSIDQDLPDVPTNTIVIDPQNSGHIYIGNDLGVFLSINEGRSWEMLSNDLPDAQLVLHLSISESNRKLRVATHGNGIWETDLQNSVHTQKIKKKSLQILLSNLYPNPTSEKINLNFNPLFKGEVKWEISNAVGQTFLNGNLNTSASKTISIKKLHSGIYHLVLNTKIERNKKNIREVHTFVKK